jgi:hypothetical protein
MNTTEITITEPSSAASREQLNALWGLLLNALVTALTETQPGHMRASMLDVARKFLADNNVVAVDAMGVSDVKKTLESLAVTRLPFN